MDYLALFSGGLPRVVNSLCDSALLLAFSEDVREVRPELETELQRRSLVRLVADGDPLFRHDAEGPDDMPAHIKASVLGPSLMLPVSRGRFALGTWQGVYLCEHRNHGGPRSVVVTLLGAAVDERQLRR